MKTPKYLTKGSKIALVAPGNKIVRNDITAAVKWIEEKGFFPVYDDRLFAEYYRFAGDDELRRSVLQEYLDREDIDAILCARGGYGTIRIIDKLDFTKFEKYPKWIIGYSDVTVLHAKMQQLGYKSIYGTMPINFEKNTKEALESLFNALIGKWNIEINKNSLQSFDDLKIVGGNLSILYSLLGSDLFPETDGKILFIEEINEYLYHIDRMMMGLKRAGKLAKLKALLVGAFTNISDSDVPFGMNYKEIIFEKVKEYGYPVIYDYPNGHIDDNHAIILG